MPTRKGLVLSASGYPQQLQSGDVLSDCLYYPISPRSYTPPASNFAVLAENNNNVHLVFASTPNQAAIWQFPSIHYGGNGFLLRLLLSAVPTTGNIQFTSEIEYQDSSTSMAFDSFATAVTGSSVAVPGGTLNYFTTTISIPHANTDSFVDNGFMRLRLTRNTAVSGNAAGNLNLVMGTLEVG